MQNHPNAIYEHLHHKKLSELMPARRDIVSLSTNDTVEKAVKTLGEKGILSAPVLDDKSGQCLGVVDMLDIVSFVVSVAPEPLSLQRNELQTLEIAGRAIAWESIKNILDASGRNPYVPVFENNPVTMATGLFAQGLHRVPILNEENQLVHTFSQTDVVKYLADNIHVGKMKVIAETPIDKLGLGQQGVISCSPEDTVLVALQKLKAGAVSALAVVDPDTGKLVGNFSASDLKGLYKEQFPSFLLTVRDYLEKHSPNSLNPIAAKSDTPFLTLLKEFVECRVHRLWVLEDFKPVGVVSLTDVMKVVQDSQL